MASDSLKQTLGALNAMVQGDMADLVAEAMPGITRDEAMARADELAWDAPLPTIAYWLEVRRIRLAIKGMQP